MICSANQLTGFYMMGTLGVKRLSELTYILPPIKFMMISLRIEVNISLVRLILAKFEDKFKSIQN